MNVSTVELLIQFSLVKAKIHTVLSRFEDALREDHIENADMFDRTRKTFSSNLHPNRTLRTLETDLEKEGEDFLYLLAALLEAGKEATLGLADYDTPERFAQGTCVIMAELRARDFSERSLAHLITEVKAEHSVVRLAFALEKLASLTGQ